jgi:hypothetical protein
VEFVGILRALRRRRVLVVLGALVALAAGAFATHRVSLVPPELQSRETDSGLASVRLLVDTPRSLVATARAIGDDTISTRAALLSSLVGSDEVRVEIAREAGLAGDELGVADSDFGAPHVATPLSRAALEVARPSEPNVVTMSVQDPQLPIISIQATASNPSTAARLVERVTVALESLVRPPEPVARRAVTIEQLGPARIGRVVMGPGRAKAVIAAVVIFGLWCAAVVVFDGAVRRRAAAGGRSRRGEPPWRMRRA